jgi:hypothetical protein
MSAIKEGRFTARPEGDFVVFLIGMRFNRLWRVHKWAPVFLAMPRMIAELERQPELGFLGANTWFGRTTLMVQYWRSFEQLETYAKAREKAHLPAWAAFNRTVGANGDVGIFHETYKVASGDYENIYANMPPIMLGRATGLIPVRAALDSARNRLGEQAPARVDA